MQYPFRHVFRVRYAEVDPQSVVYNSRYLEYADVLVTEFFRERRTAGMPDDLEFHVRRAEVDYLVPIRNDELIEGQLTVEKIGNSSMTMLVSLHGAKDGSHRADIRLIQVRVDLASGKPLPIEDEVRAAYGFASKEKIDG